MLRVAVDGLHKAGHIFVLGKEGTVKQTYIRPLEIMYRSKVYELQLIHGTFLHKQYFIKENVIPCGIFEAVMLPITIHSNGVHVRSTRRAEKWVHPHGPLHLTLCVRPFYEGPLKGISTDVAGLNSNDKYGKILLHYILCDENYYSFFQLFTHNF